MEGPIINEVDDCDAAVELVVQSIQSCDVYDLIIIDHHLGRTSGAEVVRKMRMRGYRGVIIGLVNRGLTTTSGDDDDFMCSGANHVLTKPLNCLQLMSVMRDEKFVQ